MRNTLFMREENFRRCLDGICAACGTKGLTLESEWDGTRLYKTGTCMTCDYEHHIKVQHF
jgi:hypothetical protein